MAGLYAVDKMTSKPSNLHYDLNLALCVLTVMIFHGSLAHKDKFQMASLSTLMFVVHAWKLDVGVRCSLSLSALLFEKGSLIEPATSHVS